MRRYTAVIQAGTRVFVVEQTGEGEEARSTPVLAAVAANEGMAEWLARTISHHHNIDHEQAANMAPTLDEPESNGDA